MKRVLAGGMLLASFVSFQAAAAEFTPNRSEVSFSGNITSSSSSPGNQTSTSTFLYGSYGYYFTPQIVGEVAANIFTTQSGGSTTGVTTVGVGAKYYFSAGKQGEFVPWVTGELDATSINAGTVSGSGVGVSGAVGATYWLTETAGPYADLRFRSSSVTIAGISVTQSDTIFEFGATFKF